MTVRRLLIGGAGSMLLIAFLALIVLWASSDRELHRVYALAPETAAKAAGPETVEEGRRLAKLFGCSSCHGPDIRGLLFNEDRRLVRNWAPNLTLLDYTDEEFAQAVRQGVRPTDGRALWGMPSQVFATMSDDEFGKVLAFIRAQARGGADATRPPGLTSRLALVLNALMPSDPHEKAAIRPTPELIVYAKKHPPLDLGPAFAAGSHLTATICSECHGSDLRGDAIEGGPDLLVASAYDAEAFQKLMRTGQSLGGRDLGIMSEVAASDFVVFTDAEIEAIHDYLVARAEALSANAAE